MTQESKSINARIDSLDLQSADLHYLVGWLISSAPVQLDDALDAVEEQRERRAQTRGRGIPRADICPKCSQPIPAEHLAEHLLAGHGGNVADESE